MAFSLTQLRAEIDSDPKALGYAALAAQSNGPEAVAARLNELNTVPADTLFRSYVPTEDLLAEMQWSEYTTWTAAVKTGIDQYFRGTRMRTGSSTLRTSIAALIPAGSASRAAMTALASRTAARAEILWGEGTNVSATNVADALAL